MGDKIQIEFMMSTEERVRILREAKPNSWVAFSGDESKVVAYGDSYSQVVKAAESVGETEPVLVKIPDTWASTVFRTPRDLSV